jgi:hypothetical protein
MPLKYADVGDVYKAMRCTSARADARGRPFGVTPDYMANAIILSGAPEALDTPLALIRAMDSEGARGRKTHFIRLQSAYAAQVVPLLKGILEQTYLNRDKAELPGLQSDPRTNTLIVTGSAREHELIGELLKGLDAQMPSSPSAPQQSAAKFELSVFETQIPCDRIAALEAAKLTERAQSCLSLQESLGQFGKTTVLYRTEQIVVLSSGPKLLLGSNVPFLRGTQVTKEGQRTSQVEYEKLGCDVLLNGSWDDERRECGEVTASIKMSALSDSRIEIGNGVLAPVFRKIEQPFSGPITSGQPIILLSVDAGGGGDTAAAYVARLVFHRQ